MSDMGEPTRADIVTKVRELLGRATLARARNQRDEAMRLVQEALALDDASAEAHELRGDLLLDVKRGDDAMASYRRAMELHPDRPTLEEKVARAALLRAARQQTLEMSQAILEGRAKPAGPKKSPAYAALLSVIAPGLGQLYNGEVMKGFAMLIGFVFVFALLVLAVLREIAANPLNVQAMYGRPMDTGSVASAVLGNTLLIVVLSLLYIYSVADAAISASRTMTSDETGLV
jgi:TM2 domain-containing membrane protein YozV